MPNEPVTAPTDSRLAGISECAACDATGMWFGGALCPVCGGNGTLPVTSRLAKAYADAMARVATLEKQVAALSQDAARLDWLLLGCRAKRGLFSNVFLATRAAIDEEMAKENQRA